MYFVSVTRLRVKKMRHLPAFFWHSLRSALQARRAPGNLHVGTLMDRRRVFWTLSVWQSEDDMRAFRNADVHLRVMPKHALWCDEAAYAHWSQEDSEPPGWMEAWERLVKDGVTSNVSEPSPEHETRNYPRPKAR